MNLEGLLDWTFENDYKNTFLDIVKKNKELIIFGAGIGGEKTYQILEEEKLSKKIIAFVDNDIHKIGTKYCGKKVISKNDILQVASNPLIIISSTAYNIIVSELEKIGIKKERTVYFQPARLLTGEEDREFIKVHINEFSDFYNMLEDEKSRKIVISLLNYRITKNQKWLDQMMTYIDDEKNQYFDSDILKNYEFSTGFVDGGAYTGDTLEEFLKHFPEWKANYYCFEADKKNYKELKKKADKMNLKYVEIYDFALWNKQTQLAFNNVAGGAGSYIGDDGVEKVKCISLDIILEKKQVDFIKMDIEGAEHNAIEGAKETIKRYLPILAICVYHKPEDFYDISLLIHEISEEYKFYIRQYRYGQTETVLYAVPNCRLKNANK